MQQLMLASNYSPKSIKAYIIEARYFLSYYPLKDPVTLEQSDVLGYLQWLQLNYRSSWTKIPPRAQALAKPKLQARLVPVEIVL
jgi:hypothetical protein